MKMLNDLRTGTKLIGAFLAVAAIILIVAALGHFSLKALNANLVALYDDRMVCLEQLGNAQSGFLRMRGDVYKYFLVPEQRAELKRIIAADIAAVDKNIKDYKATHLVQAEKDEIPKFDSAWAGYQQVLADFIKQVHAGDEKTPIQSLRDGVLYVRRLALEASLQNLIKIQVDVGAQVKKDSDRRFARSNVIMTVASILGVLFAIALGTLLGLSITRPLARIVGVARSMSGGDLDTGSLAGIASRRDEIGILAGAFTLMTGQLKETLEGLRRLNRELQASEEKYRIVADYTYDWETWLGLDHQFIYVSPSCKLITGYAADEFIHDSSLYGRIVHPDDREVFEKHLAEIHVESGPDCRVEFRIITRNGEERWIEHLCGNIFGSDGKWLGQRSNNRDITDRKRMARELEKHRDHLEELVKERTAELARSNTELGQFAYVASHDLQEPLRMVASYLQMVDKRYGEKLDADAREFIGFAVDGAKRMQVLINDLLAYSRVGTQGQTFQLADCEAAVQTAMRNLEVALRESGAQITCDPLPTVMGDATQLVQLFQNLIGNALKFRREEPLKIHIRAARKDGFWRLSVEDNGIGIESKHFDRIFVIFQRLHGRVDYPGTGIGLAICKKIVERHGGSIGLESEPGKGTTFFFTVSTKGASPS